MTEPDRLSVSAVSSWRSSFHDDLALWGGSVVHATKIGMNEVVHGGGGGVTCDSTIPNIPGPPAYIDFEDTSVGGGHALGECKNVAA